MDDQAFVPVSDQQLARMLDAGLADGYVGRVEFQDGETPGLVDAETVLSMASELTARRTQAAMPGGAPPADAVEGSISGMVLIEPSELQLEPDALMALVKQRVFDLAAALLDAAAEWREKRRLH